MSQSETERFANDLQNDEALRDEYSVVKPSEIDAVIAFARDKGYEFTAEEAQTFVERNAPRELSEEELASVSGGVSGNFINGNSSTVKGYEPVIDPVQWPPKSSS
ncbi:MAG: Nif11-like leader peptide family natural product precursor [Rhodospirillaceae bacterium]|jgi:predicted ribosomally synthesized peptide with nif11-like leader|nr:Nif11-like leader peptide family natural product precursor [Rhodospirillaceae bacterium]MBT3808206.1 Nif11-like leader peptide family natural product precursor [Rhodospirillaceae bacterium]MBT3932381.1 Nif11-like leader peptide family natural product precursor [Rhodospirillaceae bacterium]MBT4773359.1 Nif11-like leader peptide family natural product precursor [Rhodospirillaceae bacterium]MBT5359983.1 Nif11-like leader peptide family natural product precursor [Rhodospirillaceae bacterium]